MRTAKIVLLTLLSAGVLATFAAAAVIYAGVFNVAATEFVAFFFQRHAKTVVAGQSQLGEGAGIGQHQADTDFAALSAGRQDQARGCRSQNGS